LGVSRLSRATIAVTLIVIALIFAVYSYVNAYSQQQVSSHVVSSNIAASVNVSRLLSSLRIALVSDNKTLVEDFAKAFAGVGISKLQSYSVLSIEQAFEGVNITILDLDATRAFLKNKELIKRVFWSGRIVAFITNGVVDPVEEIFKNLNRSELPLLVIPVKGVKKVNGTEMPVYGYTKAPQVLAIRTKRIEKVESNKTYIGGLATHYYVVHGVKDIREAVIKILREITSDLYGNVSNHSSNLSGKSTPAPIIVAKAQSVSDDVLFSWVEIGMWDYYFDQSPYMTTWNRVHFYYATNYGGFFSYLYRVIARHYISGKNGWSPGPTYYSYCDLIDLMLLEKQSLKVFLGTVYVSGNTVAYYRYPNEAFDEFYPASSGSGGSVSVTIGWPPSITATWTIPDFVSYEPFTENQDAVGWQWQLANCYNYGWMYGKVFIGSNNYPTYVTTYFKSVVFKASGLWYDSRHTQEFYSFALYPATWQLVYGVIVYEI